MRSTYAVFAVVAAMSLYADETCKAQLEFLSDRIVHVVRKSPDASAVRRYPVVTMNAKGGVAPKVVVERDEKTGLLTFKRSDGTVLLVEKSAKGLEQIWTLADDEAVFGLGIWQDLALDRRGKKRRMIQANTLMDFVTWPPKSGARSSSRTRRGAIAPRRSATATPTAESSSSRRTGRTRRGA